MNLIHGELAQVESVLANALYCHVAFSLDGKPYVLPLNFGYLAGSLYFHSSPQGKKMQALHKDPYVSFAVEHGVTLREGKSPCKYGMRYTSVVGAGRAAILNDQLAKTAGLDVIIDHYHIAPGEYPQQSLDDVVVFRLEIDEVSYKERH